MGIMDRLIVIIFTTLITFLIVFLIFGVTGALLEWWDHHGRFFVRDNIARYKEGGIKAILYTYSAEIIIITIMTTVTVTVFRLTYTWLMGWLNG